MMTSTNPSFNSTTSENASELDWHGINFTGNRIEMNLLESTIIFLMWFLLQSFGNIMIIGMIFYEREGNGDPLKRGIIDQIFTNCYCLMLVMNLIPTNMLGWSALTPFDFPETITYIVPFIGKMCAEFTALSVIESIVLRYMSRYIWKRIPPINHEFTVVFLTTFNTTLSFLEAFVTICSGNLHGLKRLQGLDTELRSKPNFTPWNDPLTIVMAIVISIAYEIRKIFEKIKEHKDKKKIFITQLGNNEETATKYNNNRENPEVTKSISVALFTIVAIGICIPIFHVLFFKNSPFSTEWHEFHNWLVADFLFPFCLNFVYPLILYYQNSRLRKYVLEAIASCVR